MPAGRATMTDPVFVKTVKVDALNPGDPPIDITGIVQAVDPNALARILTRIEVYDVGGAEVPPRFFSVARRCAHTGCNILKGSEEWNEVDRPIVFSMFGADGIDYAVIQCPCHGSRFDLTNGRKLFGPATKNLARFETKIESVEGENWVFVALTPAA